MTSESKLLARLTDRDYAGFLSLWREQTQARAVGLWQVVGTDLVQLGFAADPTMTQEVREGFREATRNVPLTATGLGIVQAVLQKQLVEARPDRKVLPGSEGWLVKFGADQSLAAPVLRDGQVVGAVALAVAPAWSSQQPQWSQFQALVGRIVL